MLASCDDFTYETYYDEIYITGYKGGETTNLIIPSFIGDKPVTKILANAFKNNTYIETISISQLVEIENEAFSGCINLTNINLSKIENIGQKAFYDCENLNNVEIDNVKTIGNQAFYGCSSLLSIKLSKIESIGNQALGYSADEQRIPTFVIYGYSETVAEEYANAENITFRSMFTDLEHFYYNTYSNNGNTEIYISFVDSFTTGNLIIPSEYNGIPITKIGTQAFYNCSFITGIVLPSSIKTIESQAFYGCTLLESINLENVTSIGTHSFGQCSSLKELNAPLLEEIPTYAFEGCNSLTIVDIPNAKIIGENTFGQCNRLKTVISPSLEIIKYSAFAYDYFLESIDTSNLKVLGTKTGNDITSQIFVFCENLKYLYLPKIEEIGDATFSGAGVEYVVIGRNFNNYYSIPISSSIKIYGYSGSYANTYANEKGNQFIPLDEFAITTNLSNNIQVDKNQSLTLNISSSGFGQTYQWYKSITNSTSNGTLLKGIKTNEFSVDTSSVGTFYYYAVVKNWDNATLTSNICAVNVNGSGNIFVITASYTGGGTISPSGNVDVEEGESQTFTFTANTGYHLSSLLIDDIAVNSNQINDYFINGFTFTNVNNAHKIQANFEINTYTITIIQSDYGTISMASDYYNYGTSATFTISADDGYSIAKLIIDSEDYISGDMTSYTFTNISSNHTLSAFFIPNNNTAYKVNHFLESLSSDGAIYYNGNYYLFEESENLIGVTNTLTNVTAKNFIGFVNLEIEQRNIVSNGSTQVNVYYNRNIFNITIIKGNGIAQTSGNGNYKYEEDVVINVDTNEAYNWVNWTSDNLEAFPATTEKQVAFKMPASNLILTANATIKAQWQIENYNIDYNLNGGTNNSLNPSQYNIESDTIVLENATKQGYDFVGWYNNAEFNGSKVNYIEKGSSGNVSLYAKFEPKKCLLVFDLGSSRFGNITCDNADINNLNYGDSITLTITPDDGYAVDKVFVNGTEKQLQENKLIISILGENTAISVSYKTTTTNIPQESGNENSNSYMDNTIIICIAIVGIFIIVLLLCVLINFVIKYNKLKKQILKQNQTTIQNMEQTSPTPTNNTNFRNLPPKPPIPPIQSMQTTRITQQTSDMQQTGNVTQNAIEFAKKQANNFIEFCKRNNLDYVNNYNYAALVYYQAYLRSLKDKK